MPFMNAAIKERFIGDIMDILNKGQGTASVASVQRQLTSGGWAGLGGTYKLLRLVESAGFVVREDHTDITRSAITL